MALSSRPAKVIANAFKAGFHRTIQRARPPPVGSSERVTNYRHQRRGLVGEVAAGPDGATVAALIDSIAFVLQMTRRTSTSYSRNGTNSAHEFGKSRSPLAMATAQIGRASLSARTGGSRNARARAYRSLSGSQSVAERESARLR